MKVNGKHYRSLWWDTDKDALQIIDQRVALNVHQNLPKGRVAALTTIGEHEAQMATADDSIGARHNGLHAHPIAYFGNAAGGLLNG